MVNVNMILLAAGKSSRFGSNKLLYRIGGRRMYEYILESALRIRNDGEIPVTIVIVTAYEEIEREAGEKGVTVVKNDRQELGISHSLKLGLKACKNGQGGQQEYYLFSVCDQPYLKATELEDFLVTFLKTGKGIGCMSYQGEPGNPVIFSRLYREELLALEGDRGGKAVLKRHEEDTFFYEVEHAVSLRDMDRMEEAGECI